VNHFDCAAGVSQTPDIPGLLGEIAIARGAARHAPASAPSFVMAQDVAAARMRVIALTRDALLAKSNSGQVDGSSPARESERLPLVRPRHRKIDGA
jgi:hypothetical protein